MTYTVKNFISRGEGIVHWLEKEFASIRTGRATPMLLDLVQVESYGTRVPIQQVGSISVEDARTLRISVWDQSVIKAVEKAITEADLGISLVTDSSGLRAIFPELTSERRVQLMKIAKAKLEEARVSLRGARDEEIKKIDSMQKSAEISEDQKFVAKEELQKKVDFFNNALGSHLELKEKEINS